MELIFRNAIVQMHISLIHRQTDQIFPSLQSHLYFQEFNLDEFSVPQVLVCQGFSL